MHPRFTAILLALIPYAIAAPTYAPPNTLEESYTPVIFFVCTFTVYVICCKILSSRSLRLAE